MQYFFVYFRIKMMISKQRKLLLLGPSGAGKSTLCNAIINQKVDMESLRKPARVSLSANGVTDKIVNYWGDNSLVVTDTIAFDSSCYTQEWVFNGLRNVLYVSDIRYEKVILCMNLGRVNELARVYLRFLEAIVNNPYSNMILYISGCENGMTKEYFLEMFRNTESDMLKLINSLEEESKKRKLKKINFENIVFGTLLVHCNPLKDKTLFLGDREATLFKIMEGVNTDIGSIKVKEPDQWPAYQSLGFLFGNPRIRLYKDIRLIFCCQFRRRYLLFHLWQPTLNINNYGLLYKIIGKTAI